MAHTIQPRRQGRWVTCATVVDGEVCGLMVQHVRHKVRRSFWRHTSGAALANLSRANRDRQLDAGGY